MRRNNPVEIVDDEVVSIARRYRVESVATLIAVCRDDEASASARAAAASKLLEYSDGKPGVAKTITRADMASLPDEAKKDLFDWLLLYFTGAGLEPLLEQAGLLLGQPSLPPPAKTKKTKPVPKINNRFTRGPAKPKPPRHIPPNWGEGGYARPSPAPGGPADAAKADPGIIEPANPQQATSGAGQDARLQPSPSLLPRLGLATDLPVVIQQYDAYGNPINLAAMRPVGRS